MPSMNITEEQIANIMLLHTCLSNLVRTIQPQLQPQLEPQHDSRNAPTHANGLDFISDCLNVDLSSNQYVDPASYTTSFENSQDLANSGSTNEPGSYTSLDLELDSSYLLWNQYIDSVLADREPHHADQAIPNFNLQETDNDLFHDVPGIVRLDSTQSTVLKPSEVTTPLALHEDPATSNYIEDVVSTLQPTAQASQTPNMTRTDFRSQTNPESMVEHLYIQERHTLDGVYDILNQSYFNVPRQRTLKRWLNKRGIRKYTNGSPRRSRRSSPEN